MNNDRQSNYHKATWRPHTITPAESVGDATLLPRLLAGEFPLIILRGFISPEELDTANRAIDAFRCEAQGYGYANANTQQTLGPFLIRYRNDLEKYFALAGTTTRILTASGSSDLGEKVRTMLQNVCGLQSVSVPEDAAGRPYADKVIRLHAPGVNNPLHSDMVGRDTATLDGLLLKDIAVQFSAVLCIQGCNGGALRLYRKIWSPADERFKNPGLGYSHEVVGDVEDFVFQPMGGDLYIFHPEAYHEVALVEPGPERRTMGCFIGFFNADHLDDAVIWA